MVNNSVTSLSMKIAGIFALALLFAAGTGRSWAQPANTVLLERWNGISGTAVANLTNNAAYPNSPASRTYPTIFEIPINSADNYGTRIRGYVTPPTTGTYSFWLAGDDNCELWLSTDANPANIRRIAFVSSWTGSRQWTKFPEQHSAGIALNAGTRYYIETRQKEGGGEDNLAVGWDGPGISGDAERPIPGSRLAPFLLVTPPAITGQPANATVNVGQTATFSVTVTGTSPSFQWRRNGANIDGATAASYTTAATVPADNGVQFSVVVGNAAGSVTSANALLTVTSAPTIVTHPSSLTVSLGQTAQFTVVAAGSGTLSYQWRRNGVSISGALSAGYTTPPTTTTDNGAQYSVVVSNSQGSVSSNPANLVVVTPPSIVTQPVNATVNAGQTATFSVTAAGTSPSYQWRRNGANISGANAATYTTAATVPADNGAQFSVVVSNPAGSVTSTNGVLIVIFVMPNNRKVAISGELVDAAGNPLGFPTPVTVDAIITLLDGATSGSNRYTEEFRAAAGKGIRVENGLFVARLGEGVTTQNLQQVLTANPSLWAEITIDDGTPDILAPRTPITASAYSVGGIPAAAAATVLSGAGNPNTLQVEGAVGTSYVNTQDNTTWYKLTTAWKLMD